MTLSGERLKDHLHSVFPVFCFIYSVNCNTAIGKAETNKKFLPPVLAQTINSFFLYMLYCFLLMSIDPEPGIRVGGFTNSTFLDPSNLVSFG
jgi:hypothetical protein